MFLRNTVTSWVLGALQKKSICKLKSELLNPPSVTLLFLADEQIHQGWDELPRALQGLGVGVRRGRNQM